MTAAAGVRRARLNTERRTWNSEAVISPGIHDHVISRRHVAVDAANCDLIMPVVIGAGERRWQMTGGADRVRVFAGL